MHNIVCALCFCCWCSFLLLFSWLRFLRTKIFFTPHFECREGNQAISVCISSRIRVVAAKILTISFIGDGLIQEKELQHVMRACMDENGMKFDEGEVDELTRALFHDATVVTTTSGNSQAPSGGITFDALKAQLTKHDGLLQNLSISIDRWLVPPKPKKPATFMESMMAKVRRIE